MDLLFINQQYGNCFHEQYRIDFIDSAYKEERRMSRYLEIKQFMRDIAVLFVRGA